MKISTSLFLVFLIPFISFGQGPELGNVANPHDFSNQGNQNAGQANQNAGHADSKSEREAGRDGGQRGEGLRPNVPTPISFSSKAVSQNSSATNEATGVSSHLSNISVFAINKIKSDRESIRFMKNLLLGNELIALLQNPFETSGDLLLKITSGDWEDMANAFKNLSAVERQQIDKDIDEVLYELNTAKGTPQISAEINFWEKFQQQLFHAIPKRQLNQLEREIREKDKIKNYRDESNLERAVYYGNVYKSKEEQIVALKQWGRVAYKAKAYETCRTIYCLLLRGLVPAMTNDCKECQLSISKSSQQLATAK